MQRFTAILLILSFAHAVLAQLPAVSKGTVVRHELFTSRYVPARNVDVWLPEGYSPRKKYPVIYMQDGQMLSLDDVQEILRIPLIGVIPESTTVLDASNQGLPAIHLKDSDVSEAYKDVIGRFLGEKLPMRFTEAEKPGFFKRLFGGGGR